MFELYTIRDLKRCLVISAVVGTILVSINQGPAFFLAPLANPVLLGRAGINYLVPFTVASVSAWMANRAHRGTSGQRLG
jgi:hypothetical protein